MRRPAEAFSGEIGTADQPRVGQARLLCDC
jgi:hypothetical protein